jgi:hypothetical protein
MSGQEPDLNVSVPVNDNKLTLTARVTGVETSDESRIDLLGTSTKEKDTQQVRRRQ